MLSYYVIYFESSEKIMLRIEKEVFNCVTTSKVVVDNMACYT